MEIDDYKFTKSHTEIAKGIAILLMICFHLFGFPNRILNVDYISIVPLTQGHYEYLLGRFGYICVPIFLFLSGYGLYLSYMKKNKFTFLDALTKGKSFLLNYWMVFILFVPIGLIWFHNSNRYSWNFYVFISNFFALNSSYNSEWWFARLYIELVLLFPIIKHFLSKNNIYIVSTSLLLCILQSKFDMLFKIQPQLLFIKKSIFYNDIVNILLWQIVFVMGCLIAKHNLFKVTNMYLKQYKLEKNVLQIFFVLIIIIAGIKIPNLINISPTYVAILITPIFVLLSTNVINVSIIKYIFIVLGKHSGNMWLTHTFFAYYYFQKIVFYPEFSVIIVIWVCLLSITSSIIIKAISSRLYNITHYLNFKIKKQYTLIKRIIRCVIV